MFRTCQAILNYRRKFVGGLSIDSCVLSVLGHSELVVLDPKASGAIHKKRSQATHLMACHVLSCPASYLVYNMALYSNKSVQEEYRRRHDGANNTVQLNDVASSIHVSNVSQIQQLPYLIME